MRLFRDLPDPRTGRHLTHALTDLIAIAVLAVVCGADGWVQVRLRAASKAEWLATFLDLPGGIPSHDTTLSEVERAAACSPGSTRTHSSGRSWRGRRAWPTRRPGGWSPSTGRRSAAASPAGGTRAGWPTSLARSSARGENKLVFSQVAVAGKSDEIVAIPGLLALLDLNGAVVTIDAIGCQREVAAAVVGGGGDYLLPVKGNQPALPAKATAVMPT